MGAGASASEQNELRAAFAEFDPSMSHEDCRVLLEKHAPTLMARTIQGSTEGGDNSSIMAAVAALHDQFTMAHHKLRGGGQGQNAGENSGGATSTDDVAEAAELAARGEKDSELAAMSRNDCAMRGVRELGRRPKESVKSPPEERRLATRLRKAKRRGKQSEAQKEELAAMSANDTNFVHTSVTALPNPQNARSDTANNKFNNC